MGYSLFGTASLGAVAQAAGTFSGVLGGNTTYTKQATEAAAQLRMPVAGTLLGLTALTVAGTFTGQLRQNGANANQSISDTALTSGAGDVVAQGDLIDLAWTAAAAATVSRLQMRLGSSPHAAIYAASPTGSTTNTISANNRQYFNPVGSLGQVLNTVTATVQQQVGVAGLLQGLSVNITANAMTSAQKFTLYLNGALGAQGPTIGPGLTGVFQDTTTQTTVNVGDLFCATMLAGGGVVSQSCAAIGFVNPSAPVNDLFCYPASGMGANFTAYYPLVGGTLGVGLGSDAAAATPHGFPVAMSGLKVNVTANAMTGPGTLTTRKNGVAGNQSATIGAGLTGWFADATNQDVLTSTDTANYRVLTGPGPGNPLTIAHVGVVETSLTLVSEAGAAADVVTSAGLLPLAVAESGAALDTPSVVSSVTRPAIYEAGRAFDTPSGGVSRGESVAEQGAAQDVTAAFGLVAETVIEQGAARDAQIVMGSLAYAQVLGMTARVVHRHAVVGGILDDEAIPLLDDDGVPVFEDT
jgi:hypothetical protein